MSCLSHLARTWFRPERNKYRCGKGKFAIYAYIFVKTGVIEKVYVLGAARTARSLGCT